MDSEHIYETLKEQIIELIIPPESILNISDLAQTFGASRTPLKEILIRLQAEGWIVNQGGHFIVPSLSLERFIELTEIRIALEIQANIWAIDRISQGELQILQEVEKEILKLDHASSNTQIHKIDFKLHQTLYKAAKNSQLTLILDRLLRQHHRFWLSIPREREPKLPVEDTLNIIKAIRKKDKDLIRNATRAHIQWSVDTVKGFM